MGEVLSNLLQLLLVVPSPTSRSACIYFYRAWTYSTMLSDMLQNTVVIVVVIVVMCVVVVFTVIINHSNNLSERRSRNIRSAIKKKIPVSQLMFFFF